MRQVFDDPLHIPVLTTQIMDMLEGRHPLVDVTVGFGGHLKHLLEALPAESHVMAIDRDGDVLRRTKDDVQDNRVTWVHGRFSDVELHMKRWGHQPMAVIADLGVSSFQLDENTRGFSFKREGPLDMRMDRTQRVTAQRLIQSISEKKLREELKAQADEPRATKIAKEIKKASAAGQLKTTFDLSRLVHQVYGVTQGQDCAMKTFLALRRLVNDEGPELMNLLNKVPECLAVGGRFAVISFHSGEDRIVKQAFNELCRLDQFRLLTKKPILPDQDEIRQNPRARSSKLRVIEKVA